MLEKVYFFDAHFHLNQFLEVSGKSIDDLTEMGGCISCHSKGDFDIFSDRPGFVKSFGIHPQNPDDSLLYYLEGLVKEKKVNAVGEFGFDFYTPEFKEKKEIQKTVFEAQLEIALNYSLPVVIHCRKANELIFSYSKELSKLPGVLFHSFMGNLIEAESFMKKGLNCYFSFGKQIFNNNKKVIELVTQLPVDNLMFETDSPFQKLKNEEYTSPLEIKRVYEGAFLLKKENLLLSKKKEQVFTDFSEKINQNFCDFYKI